MTTINPLIAQSANTNSINPANSLSSPSSTTATSSFSDFMNQALSQVSSSESAATAENLKLLTGENANIHNVVLAAEKAEVALRLTMQVRNKVLDAYNEMMRIQI